jgi:hypothetical protein
MRTLVALLLLSFIPLTLAHSEQTVGSGENQYTVIFGMASEPAFTDERNGLDLIIQDPDGNGVENLEQSLSATITSPDGSAERELTLRAVYNEPGSYTDDFVLTEAGSYRVQISGFIGETEVDVTFETHEVKPLAELHFP